MSEITLRRVTADDADLLYALVKNCPPLDVHTPYTYWFICRYFYHCSFILEVNDVPVGYVMAVRTDSCVFLWQIGLLPSVRGKGYAQIMIDRVMKCAAKLGLSVQLSISADNYASNSAFRKYCQSSRIGMYEIGEAQSEILYELRYLS